MAISKKSEIRSFKNALTTTLSSQGWTPLTYKEGFKSEDTITVPTVAIHYLPSNQKAFQLGNTGEKLLKRVIQIDAYMETEDRADAIVDSIMDFIDLTTVTIVSYTSAILGTLICQDTESIYSETLAPVLTSPQILRWRGIVRATLEAHYYAP